MRVTVERHALAATLAQALKYVTNRTDIPVLSTVRLRAGKGGIEVAATNLDLLFRATMGADVEAPGAIAVNSTLIASFVRAAEGPDVELTLAGSLLEMRSGSARGRVPIIPAGDFPEPFGAATPDVSFEIDRAELVPCLETVEYAASREKFRYSLTGTGWSFQDGRLVFAATDGRVLSMTSIEVPPGAELLAPAIVPDLQMPMFSGPVRVDIANTWICFAGLAGGCPVELISKLIDGTFPDCRRIIRPATATATVSRKAFTDAVARCMPFCQGKHPAPVDLIHDHLGELVVRVLAPDGAEIEDRVEIDGEMFAVSLGGSLLAATLTSFRGEKIEIGLSGSGEGVRFSEPGDDHRLAIVMPVRATLTPRIGPPPQSETLTAAAPASGRRI